MKFDMAHEPILLPRLAVVVIVAVLGVLGVEVTEAEFLGQFSLADVVIAVAAAGSAYLAQGLTRRAFTDAPATVDRRYQQAAAIGAVDPGVSRQPPFDDAAP